MNIRDEIAALLDSLKIVDYVFNYDVGIAFVLDHETGKVWSFTVPQIEPKERAQQIVEEEFSNRDENLNVRDMVLERLDGCATKIHNGVLYARDAAGRVWMLSVPVLSEAPPADLKFEEDLS